MNVSRVQSSDETRVLDAEAALARSAPPGVVRSLAFWTCLLLAAGGYGLATLAPSYVRNQQLRAESTAADAELRRLVAQVDRYERYCGRLTAVNAGRAAVAGEEIALAAPSPRPSPPHHVESSRGVERGGEGEMTSARVEAVAPSRQIAVEESLQFQLEDAAAAGGPAAVPPHRVSSVIGWIGRSRIARGAMRVLSAVLLLLAFPLCLDAPPEPTPAVRPRRTARQLRHPLSWLGMRYRAAEIGGRN
jgi:hypothetical protein